MAKPLYVVCVFNVYVDSPNAEFPGETPEQRAERKRTYHFAGFSIPEVQEMVEAHFRRSCDHHWHAPALLGEFPTKFDDGYEVADVETLTCPHCGATF